MASPQSRNCRHEGNGSRHSDQAVGADVAGSKGRLGLLTAVTIAGLANLTALVPVTSIGNVLLITLQIVAAIACLSALGLVFRTPSVAQGTVSAAVAGPDRHKDDISPSVNTLTDKRWLGLVEEVVALLDELERHRPNLDPAARELTEHVNLRIQEILERSGVTVIAGDKTYDRNRHQTENGVTQARPGAAILVTLRPGLTVGRRVFRRAIVRLEPTKPDKQTDTST